MKKSRAVVVGSMSAGILEVYTWARGFKDYLHRIWAQTRTGVEKFMDRILEMQMAYWEKCLTPSAM